MNLLCLNVAFKKADVCIFDNSIFFEKSCDSSCKHSENLLKTVDELVEKTQSKSCIFDYIGVVVGPGSFTGLRIGIATAKGLMFSHKTSKAVPVVSLELLAYKFFKTSKAENCLVLMNALSGRLFVAVYKNDLTEVLCPQMIDKEKIKDLLKLYPTFTFASEESEFFGGVGTLIEAKDLCELVQKKIEDKKVCGINELSPLYLRKSQAEENMGEN